MIGLNEGFWYNLSFFYGYAGNNFPPFLLNGVTLFELFFMVILKIIGNGSAVGTAKFLRKHDLVSIFQIIGKTRL